MPDKETLETFLEGLEGPVQVYFDKELGKFMWHDRDNFEK